MSDYQVVILSYNHPQITESCVQSVLKLLPAEQINLVHNGTLENHKNYLQNKFTQINHTVLQKNKGFTGGANAGLKKVFEKTEWCFFLTNDCELVELGNTPTSRTISGVSVVSKKLDKVYSMGGLFDGLNAELRHCKTENDFFKSSKIFKKYIPGSAFWIHRDVFLKTGGFDETLETYWEDVDFSLRAQDMGFELGLAPNTTVSHKVGKTCFGDPYYTTYLFQRNRKRVSRRRALSETNFYRAKLEYNLAKSWGKLFLKNALAKDFTKNKLLLRAIKD